MQIGQIAQCAQRLPGATHLDKLDVTLHKAFAAFSLDPSNPFHWRRLLAYLADIHFAAQPAATWPTWSVAEPNCASCCRTITFYEHLPPRSWVEKNVGPRHLRTLENQLALRRQVFEVFGKDSSAQVATGRDPKHNKLLGRIVAELRDLYIAHLGKNSWISEFLGDQWETFQEIVTQSVIKGIAEQRPETGKEFGNPDIYDPNWIAVQRRAGIGY